LSNLGSSNLQDTPTTNFKLRVSFITGMGVGFPPGLKPGIGMAQALLEIKNRTSGESAKYTLGAVSFGVGIASIAIGDFSSPWEYFNTEEKATLGDFEGFVAVTGITVGPFSPVSMLKLPMDIDHGSSGANFWYGNAVDISGITDSFGLDFGWSPGFMTINSWNEGLPDDGWILEMLRKHAKNDEFGYSPEVRAAALNEIRQTLRNANEQLLNSLGAEKYEVEYPISRLPDDVDSSDPEQLAKYNERMFPDPTPDPTGRRELETASAILDEQRDIDWVEGNPEEQDLLSSQSTSSYQQDEDAAPEADADDEPNSCQLESEGDTWGSSESPVRDSDEPLNSRLEAEDDQEDEAGNAAIENDEPNSSELDPSIEDTQEIEPHDDDSQNDDEDEAVGGDGGGNVGGAGV
jgi:hypothetical protein